MASDLINGILTDAFLDSRFTAEWRASASPREQCEEALGIEISIWSEWDGLAIMRVFRSALEDANYHTEAAFVADKMIPLAEGDQDAWAKYYEAQQ